MEITAILAIPLLLALLPLATGNTRTVVMASALGYSLVLAASSSLALETLKNPVKLSHFFYADALSAFFVFIVALLSITSLLYSAGFVERDIKGGGIKKSERKLYYILFNLFTFTMFFATLADNLGIVWVMIEMTTLVSAFLVGFYNTEKSVEAAWKYIVICSVGISLALFGTILFYYTLSVHGGIKTLRWSEITAVAPLLDARTLKIAFIFILVGYGTKAGIAPMHTWLPDAHSQAPAPVSALLSGVLLKTALYVILRYTVIINKCAGPGYSGHLFLFFGLLSLVISAGFILIQKDIKRLLAYHSIEHMGIIFVGLGIGGFFGYYGALFHVLNHAATKSLMFFGAGNIAQKYRTHDMHSISGVMKAMPFTGIFVLMGVFALAGSPPFSIFASEIIILSAGFTKGLYFSTCIFLLVIALIFGAIVSHFSRLLFGRKPEGIEEEAGGFTGKTAFIIPALFILVLGLCMPSVFHGVLSAAARILEGG